VAARPAAMAAAEGVSRRPSSLSHTSSGLSSLLDKEADARAIFRGGRPEKAATTRRRATAIGAPKDQVSDGTADRPADA
jgi:hypothetical protein